VELKAFVSPSHLDVAVVLFRLVTVLEVTIFNVALQLHAPLLREAALAFKLPNVLILHMLDIAQDQVKFSAVYQVVVEVTPASTLAPLKKRRVITLAPMVSTCLLHSKDSVPHATRTVWVYGRLAMDMLVRTRMMNFLSTVSPATLEHAPVL
jgi:hypothetical protein